MELIHSENSIQLVSLALDAALMRQTAIASNIANANSPDYQALEVNFEEQIHEGTDLALLKPKYQLSQQPMSLDQQMIMNVANMTHYRALIKGLNQKFAIMNLALQGMNQ